LIQRFFFLFLTVWITCITLAQENPPGKILSAADFKGAPDYKEDFLARTYVTVSLRYNPVNCDIPGKVKLSVETTIAVSKKSWMKFNVIRTKEMLQELLSHEQGHYDLNEIFAAELKKHLSDSCFDKLLYKSQVDSIFKSLHYKYDKLQLKYDRDTDHMRQKGMQAKWKRDINVMLKKVRGE
jgi:predicted secreted Zn-dependent protease